MSFAIGSAPWWAHTVRTGRCYLYAYYAAVTLCDGTLIFKDKTIKVTQLK